MIYVGSNPNGLPAFSRYIWGNQIAANLQGTSSVFSGNVPFDQNFDFGTNVLNPFPFETYFPELAIQIPQAPVPVPVSAPDPVQTAPASDVTETAAGYFVKNMAAFLVALVILGIGLFIILSPAVMKIAKEVK